MSRRALDRPVSCPAVWLCNQHEAAWVSAADAGIAGETLVQSRDQPLAVGLIDVADRQLAGSARQDIIGDNLPAPRAWTSKAGLPATPSHAIPDHDIRRDRSEKRSQKSRQEILCGAVMTFPSQLRVALMPVRRAGLRTGYGSRNDQAIEAAIRDDLA